MKNDYEVRGEVTAIFINSKKYGKLETLISTVKLERANEFSGSWHVDWNWSNKSLYVVGMTKENGKQKKNRLHRWITGVSDDMYVDHIDHRTLNNIDSNLRIVTRAENRQNLKGAYANSESGVRGVGWKKSHNKWIVRIRINNVCKHIGNFDTIEEAEQASIEARSKYMPYSQEALSS